MADIGAAGGKEGGDEKVAVGGYAVAVTLGHFLDDAMGAEEAKVPAGSGRGAALLFEGSVFGKRLSQWADVAVAESSGGEFAPGDAFEQGDVVRIAEA